MEIEKSYLTPAQVASLLMVSQAGVRQWAQKGALKALTTPGGHRRFLYRDVAQFAQDRGLTLNTLSRQDLRVLIVDDEPSVASYLKSLLKENTNSTAQIEIAHDGFQAGMRVRDFKPQIVLLDLMMPGMDGFQVCETLKKDPMAKSIRIIALTGYHTPTNVERILRCGAEVCLGKPIDSIRLLGLLNLDSYQLLDAHL